MTHHKTQEDRRRFIRVPISDTVEYVVQPRSAGDATCLDAGWGGIALRLGRYLRPGKPLEVYFSLPGGGCGGLVSLPGVVTWCRPTPVQTVFHAGVAVDIRDEQAVPALSAVLLHAARGALDGVTPALAAAPSPALVNLAAAS